MAIYGSSECGLTLTNMSGRNYFKTHFENEEEEHRKIQGMINEGYQASYLRYLGYEAWDATGNEIEVKMNGIYSFFVKP